MKARMILTITALFASMGSYTITANAQAAGANADFNKKDRWEAQAQHAKEVDPPCPPTRSALP